MIKCSYNAEGAGYGKRGVEVVREQVVRRGEKMLLRDKVVSGGGWLGSRL